MPHRVENSAHIVLAQIHQRFRGDAVDQAALKYERQVETNEVMAHQFVAVSVEAGELLEHFQWTTEAQSAILPPDSAAKVEEEMADVLLYLVRLADKLDIDLVKAARRKMVLNADRYPVSKAKGSSRKYTEL